jgi:DNA-binding transcriptional LysR family regulator
VNVIQDAMDWRRLDLNLLKTLAVMLEERSVAQAAERLFVSPSAVSHALARLRRAFNDPLFVRTPQGMIPTTRARSLERPLSILMSSLEDARGDPHESFDPAKTQRTFRIAAPGALDLTLIPALTRMLRTRAPDWSLAIETFERRSYEADITSGRIDFVLSVGGHTPTGERIASSVLWEDELVVLAGPGSTIDSTHEALSIEDYLTQRQVYPMPWPVTQNFLDIKLARTSRHRTFALSVPSYAALGDVLETTDLIASMPDRTARAILRSHPTLRIVRVTPPQRSNLSLLWAATGQPEPAQQWMRKAITEAASSVPRGAPQHDSTDAP